MLIFVKLLAKYIVIIYALGSVHKKFGVWIKAVPLKVPPKVKFPAGLERLSRFKLKQAFLIISDAGFFMYLIQCISLRLVKRSASEPGLTLNLLLFTLPTWSVVLEHCPVLQYIYFFQWQRNDKARQEKNIIDGKVAFKDSNETMFIFWEV